jgi:cytochrome c553
MAEIQDVARLTSEATTLEAAASGVATMARLCGGCHEATDGGMRFEPGPRERTTAPSDTLDARMGRHMWAADRLWEGLTGPSNEAWEDGVSALAHTPAAPPVTDPPLPQRFVAALIATRELADSAAAATTLAQRSDVYGLFLATCARCHGYGVELDF